MITPEVLLGSEGISIKKYALIISAMSSFLPPFMGSAVNLAIPSIGRSLNGSAVMLSWLVSGFLLVTASLLLPVGRFADIWGRKKVFVSGIITFSLFSLLCAQAWSMESLIAFRVFQAAGAAMIFSTGLAILTSVYPPYERGRVLGINVACTYAGLSFGPVLGGVLNHQFGWTSIFLFGALWGSITCLLAVTKLDGEWADSHDEQFDLSGAVLYTAGVALTIFGFSSLVTSSHWAKSLFIIGLTLLGAFVRHELKAKHPIMDIKLFISNIVFTFSNMAALISYSATFAVGFLLSIHLQLIKGFNSQIAGLILLSQPILMALLSPLAGRLSDHMEPRILASIGMSITTLGLFMFAFIREATPVWIIALNLMLMGTGFALFASPNTNAVMGSVDKKFYGVASAALGTMRLIGQSLSMAIATVIIDFYIGDVKLNMAAAGKFDESIRTSFGVFAVICFAGVFASLAQGNMKPGIGENNRR
jgi:EmrB/QacA subfamily drug resistance transporter